MTAGGTLYSTATGGSAVAGATITLTDSKGTKIKMITGKTGNFYASSAISFPATVEVSKCPDTVTMMATITEGGCNRCHNSSMRVHLP